MSKINDKGSGRKGKAIKRRRTVPMNKKGGAGLSLTLDEARDYVLAYKRSEGLRDKTLEDYDKHANYLRDWLAEYYPEIDRINEVSSGIIRDYINYLQHDHFNQRTKEYGLAPTTINIRLRNMSSSFNVLHKEKVINDNPMALINTLKTDEDSFIPLTDDEKVQLLSVPNQEEYAQFRDYVCMNLILDTGIRSSEMFDTKIEYVDFRTRVIYLPGEVTKNRKPRILPLSNEVMNLLIELISEVKHNWHDAEYVFLSNFGEKYLPTSFTRRVRRYRERANIDKQVTPHGLRHQFCRDYILNGGDVFSLQRIAGHSDIATTRKYIQLSDEDISGEHARFSPIARLRRRKR